MFHPLKENFLHSKKWSGSYPSITWAALILITGHFQFPIVSDQSLSQATMFHTSTIYDIVQFPISWHLANESAILPCHAHITYLSQYSIALYYYHYVPYDFMFAFRTLTAITCLTMAFPSLFLICHIESILYHELSVTPPHNQTAYICVGHLFDSFHVKIEYKLQNHVWNELQFEVDRPTQTKSTAMTTVTTTKSTIATTTTTITSQHNDKRQNIVHWPHLELNISKPNFDNYATHTNTKNHSFILY